MVAISGRGLHAETASDDEEMIAVATQPDVPGYAINEYVIFRRREGAVHWSAYNHATGKTASGRVEVDIDMGRVFKQIDAMEPRTIRHKVLPKTIVRSLLYRRGDDLSVIEVLSFKQQHSFQKHFEGVSNSVVRGAKYGKGNIMLRLLLDD